MARGEHAIGVAVAAIAGEADRAFDALVGILLPACEEVRARRHQRRLGKIGHLAGVQRARAVGSFIARHAAVAGEALAGEGLVHHAVDRYALAGQPDQRAPDRDAGDEGAGAVDRVEHPDIVGVGVLGAEFLAEDAVGREGALDQVAHHVLAGAIALGHGVEDAAARLVLGGMPGAEEGQDRLARQGRQPGNEFREIDRAHQAFLGSTRLPPSCCAARGMTSAVGTEIGQVRTVQPQSV